LREASVTLRVFSVARLAVESTTVTNLGVVSRPVDWRGEEPVTVGTLALQERALGILCPKVVDVRQVVTLDTETRIFVQQTVLNPVGYWNFHAFQEIRGGLDLVEVDVTNRVQTV
jgi:hypothetical protein